MRAEIWSPDGIEAAAVGALYEVLQAENEDAIALVDDVRGIRVWLDGGDEMFLRQMLAKLDRQRTLTQTVTTLKLEEAK